MWSLNIHLGPLNAYVEFLWWWVGGGVWKSLFTGTVPVSKAYLTAAVPVNKAYVADTVSVNMMQILGTVSVN